VEKWGEPEKRVQLEKEGINLSLPTDDKHSVGASGAPAKANNAARLLRDFVERSGALVYIHWAAGVPETY
jgi:hypothetical protein